MKKTILFMLVAVLSTTSISAQNTKKAIYVIDCKVIEKFDGSQLNNKTIVSYSIDSVSNIHSILTSEFVKGKKIASQKIYTTIKKVDIDSLRAVADSLGDRMLISGDNIVWVINDKVVTYGAFKRFFNSNFNTMKVIKDKKDPEFIKYAKIVAFEPKLIIKATTSK